MFTTARRRDRRRFQPSFDSLSQRIVPTLFMPAPSGEPVTEVTYPDCQETGEPVVVESTPAETITQVTYPDCLD